MAVGTPGQAGLLAHSHVTLELKLDQGHAMTPPRNMEVRIVKEKRVVNSPALICFVQVSAFKTITIYLNLFQIKRSSYLDKRLQG